MTVASIEEARKAIERKEYLNAESIYIQLLTPDSNLRIDKQVDLQESAILELGELYQLEQNESKLLDLIEKSRKIMSGSFAKSKSAKIIKSLLDIVENTHQWENQTLEGSIDLTIKVNQECIDWAIDEKRSFLRQSLQIRSANLYYKKKYFQDSLKIINELLTEFKKLDDKSSLVDVQLLECKNYFQLKNFAKSKAALTSARTSANSIYCPSSIQAELDLMSGILNAQDNDFKTAYSYFYESFENYQIKSKKDKENNFEDLKSMKVLKYMLLCKIMIGNIDEVNQILKQKNVQQFISKRDIEAMKNVSVAYKNRSLKELEDCLKNYNNELTLDVIIRSHLSDLYDSLFQQNLLKLIEPYSIIEINHICAMIGLSKNIIESKLSNMILDKVFYGVLDQGNGWLIIYDEPKRDETYDLALDVVKHMSDAVDALYEKAGELD
ncbi:proteasome regulatory particle lid subunit [Martiniozyma asiatica (nom. inval.)]|nr:proteasome regulatory particle lid subunit [Martiniozyma asiatica]